MARLEHKVFYQAQYLNHILSIKERYSFFGFNGNPLAEHATTQTLLLGIEPQRTILSAVPGRVLAYTPYGQRNVNSATQPLLGFNGELRQKNNDCYLLGRGYRSYNTTLMRFQSPDSQSPFKHGGINSYAYCSGDPINFIDPSGQGKFSNTSTKIFADPIPTVLKYNKQNKSNTKKINNQRNSLKITLDDIKNHLDPKDQEITRHINNGKNLASTLLTSEDTPERNALIDYALAGNIIAAEPNGFAAASAIGTHGNSHYMKHLLGLSNLLLKTFKVQPHQPSALVNSSVRDPNTSNVPK